nr:pentatricopeptide repeat-containing protein [Tanacetum cinerariifolium]
MSVEDLVSWTEKEAAMTSKTKEKFCDDDISVTSILDKGKRKMVDEGNAIMSRKSAQSRNSDLEEMFYSNTDSESEYSDNSVDYLFEGKDELISHRKRNNEAKKIQIQVDEKYVDADQLKECLTYYSLANGFSLWFYRSLKDRVIARCGLRPEKLKDIKKGKQRKCNKYPSAGRDELSNYPFRCYGKTMVTEKLFQIVNNCKKGLVYEHYNAVLPPHIENFMPPTPDLSFIGLDEFANKPLTENTKSSKEKTKVVRKNHDASIIKEWVSDDEENVTQPKIEKKIK